MSYIGTQPVPQSLQSRQQFTGDGSTTTFTTIGGVELYEDVFLNGVRLSRVDNEYSFDGTTLTISPAPANGDTVSIILRNDHSELIALPITDSAGNNVLSESGGVVTLAQDIINGTSTYGFARLRITSNQTTTGDITFNDPVGDTTNFTRSGVNITLGLSGIYFIVFSPTFLTNSEPERAVQASIRLSDDTELAVAYDQIQYLDSAESYSNASCSYVGHFNANDEIKFYFNSYSGGTSDIGSATHANIVLLRRTA